MFEYQAPNPYEDYSPSISLTASRSIKRFSLTPQSHKPKHISPETILRFAIKHQTKIRHGFVKTFDEATLETIEIKPQDQMSLHIDEQSYLVKFNGNGMHYQDALRDFTYDALHLNICVVGFNYRGVGNSQKAPDTFQDLVTDGIAQVQRLLDKGVKSHKITLDGLSIGGGVATLVAAHFHRRKQPLYLWNDRSFAVISKETARIFAPETRGIFRAAYTESLAVSSFNLIAPAGWEVNVAKAYNSIPAQYKGHCYVAKKSAKSFGDGIVDDPASLHQSVKQHESQNNINTGHKVYARSNRFRCGHNMPRSKLIDAKDHDLSGQAVFEAFVKNHR